jgi:hypothetical protein
LRVVLLLGCALLQAPGVAESAPPETAAAWKQREMEFVYLGFTTRYSCEGLRDKLRALLAASGARPGFDVATRACSAPAGQVTEFPRVHLVFHVAEVPAAGARDVGEPVVARWRPVNIARRQPRVLETGDCELVEQFRDRVLPAFTTRGLDSDINCIPHQLAGSSFTLKFEVLEGIASDAVKPAP